MLSLWLLILIGCFTMVLKDATATFLTIAEARGNSHLAGILNALGTPANAIFYSFSTVEMLHGHGVWGWLGLLPIMCVDYVDGRVFTSWGRRIKSDAVAE